MKVAYYDDTRLCSIADGKPIDLDSAAANHLCFYCHGGITVQRCDDQSWRLWCPQCGPLDEVASKYAGRSSRLFVNEPMKKGRKNLFGGE